MPIADKTNTHREQDGLKWERDTLSLTPVWTLDPRIRCMTDICYKLLQKSCPEDPDPVVKVAFLSEGAFNRIHMVDVILKVKASPD
jgi:hypothetical protein